MRGRVPLRTRSGGGRPWFYALVSVVCAAALLVGVAEGGAGAWAEQRWGDRTPQAGGATLAPAARTTIDAPVPAGSGPALPVVTGGGVPAADRLAAAIDAVPLDGLTGGRSGVVLDPASGAVLYGRDPDHVVIPASTMKVLTSMAALDLLGPAHVFTTRAVSTGPGSVVLVGGGDPYLSSGKGTADPERASLADLAADTAAALRSAGTTRITLSWDASLFEGPSRSPDWPAAYADQVTPVSALTVDQGRLAGTSPGPRTTTPAADAAGVFAAALADHGIVVTSRSALQGSVPSSAQQLAAVDSPPLAAIVEDLMVHSDNDAAEIIAHQVGVAAGTGGTFEGGAAGVRQVLQSHGLWNEGAVLRDGSGLSRSNRVTPAMLAGAVALATREARYRAVLTGMPVAAATGTLTKRFGAPAAQDGRGEVRAKTGTLSATSALAGYTVSHSGAVVVFSFVVNDASGDDAARAWLDRVATTVVDS
ncbi:D-alanyl-D-alanine carboxypeptidase / D-alanyl-D-alanine-endopeptidase (penicillin-binding protein 4) [Raineyella antarctica]|uniref:D-alanyl-D-alanine carboxypeptidase / D-alanyl-D-alanine-endopeptidase (Penicillin-binding protein 4) n=1 Tax=Raineyella antarctica TaxID=1577474 RepID=A0A1G6IIZ5_9ACTN|nr:D-alanyl-D-alanine carboxypeptidase/D-alanyl-D-alanine-endopeptidase [Raineyella antarctica]SDC06393.1 D-alanyl-D-alanine carboxypeptidase / D-alanyl-D-alanine-endopeptidase (penicillin-binding protein 4) [Raineyella antarctica]